MALYVMSKKGKTVHVILNYEDKTVCGIDGSRLDFSKKNIPKEIPTCDKCYRYVYAIVNL